MANIDKKSKKATLFRRNIIIHLNPPSFSIPPSPISQQRKNLAEVSYLELDSLQRVNFISGCIFSDNDNLVYQYFFLYFAESMLN